MEGRMILKRLFNKQGRRVSNGFVCRRMENDGSNFEDGNAISDLIKGGKISAGFSS
jgi:hypothetical protein